jgi:hypothetical protein
MSEAQSRAAPLGSGIDRQGDSTMTDLNKLEADTLKAIGAAKDEAALEAVRVGALGKKGSISELLKTLGGMSPEERKTKGAQINALKDKANEAIAAKRTALKHTAMSAQLAADTVDVTLPVRTPSAERGRIHPVSQVVDEITAIFADMGFAVAEGPDIETDFYNFTALNFPGGPPGAGNARHVLLSIRSRTASGCSCARTLRRCRSAPCRRRSRRSRSSFPAAPIAATPTRRTRRCFIRWRGSSSTSPRISVT